MTHQVNRESTSSANWITDSFYGAIDGGKELLGTVGGWFGASTLATHKDAKAENTDAEKRKQSWCKTLACGACVVVTSCACAIIGGIWSVISCITAPFFALCNLCRR